jgi:hypothetical protein
VDDSAPEGAFVHFSSASALRFHWCRTALKSMFAVFILRQSTKSDCRFLQTQGIFDSLCGVSMIRLFALLIFVATAAHCLARIGDTLDESITRYGKPITAAGDTAMFEKPPYYVTVHLSDGKTDAITYVKSKKGANGESEMSPDEIDRLLGLNSDQQWKQTGAAKQWGLQDGSLLAVYTKDKFLVITTADYKQRLAKEAAEKKAEEQRKAEQEKKAEQAKSEKKKSGKSGHQRKRTKKRHASSD